MRPARRQAAIAPSANVSLPHSRAVTALSFGNVRTAVSSPALVTSPCTPRPAGRRTAMGREARMLKNRFRRRSDDLPKWRFWSLVQTRVSRIPAGAVSSVG